MAADDSIPYFWILLFFALALGLGAAAIIFVGGSLFGGLVAPFG
jgi:hypothetical protein